MIRKATIWFVFCAAAFSIWHFGPRWMALGDGTGIRPAHWMGDDWTFPHACRDCGVELVPGGPDELSVYRECPKCHVRFRHPSWPKTLEAQASL